MQTSCYLNLKHLIHSNNLNLFLDCVSVVAKVNWRIMYTLAPNFEANVYISPKLQTLRLMCTLAPNFEANVYINPKLQTWRLMCTLFPNLEAKVNFNFQLRSRLGLV